MTRDLLLGGGLVLAAEGLLYAAAPAAAQTMLRRIAELPTSQVRVFGVIALALAVMLVAIGRG